MGDSGERKNVARHHRHFSVTRPFYHALHKSLKVVPDDVDEVEG
jgi:hypothetical protein